MPEDGPFAHPFSSSKERLRLRLYLALAALDLAVIAAAFMMGNVVRLGQLLHPQGRDILVLLLPVYLGLAIDQRAYSIDALTRPRAGIARALTSLAIGFAAVMGFLFYMKVGILYSRLAVAIATLGAFALLPLARYLFVQWAGQRHNWSFVNEALLIDSLPVQPKCGEIAIFADKAKLAPRLDDPVMLDRVGRFLTNCDRVVLACPPEMRPLWSRMLKGMDVDAELLAPELENMGALGIRSSHGRSTLLISCSPLGIRGRILKRGFDMVVATSALAMLAPLMLAVAIIIKLESPGPVFFTQPRVGRDNRIFHVLKFRSMRSDAADEQGIQSTCRGDARLTRIGSILRQSSIDELPQLFNVLKGEMSIVGPRPHALASTAGDRLFWSIDSRYASRHVVKPGITGLAQIRGLRGATLTENDLLRRLQADLDYLCGWTLWRDCRILMNTVLVIVHKNAY